MHRYFPHTPEDEARMLAAVGAGSVEELFATVPECCRPAAPLNLPDPLTEWELMDRAKALAASMPAPDAAWVGAGSYTHHIPAVVPALSGRSEFLTSYTPYQAEMSQGTLQGIFEFQTLISRLMGLEVANASMYDGATALAEGALMACRLTKRSAVAVSALVHPHYRAVLRTYCTRGGLRYEELPASDGHTDLSLLATPQAGELAAIIIQSPNFLGVAEDLKQAADAVHAHKGLLISCVTEPLAFGLAASPGSLGADIACGEGQSLGLPHAFGGPGLGLLATRKAFVRNIPGRLVGLTKDTRGRRAFVLTLSTREQHIRREKAVSNICSNAGWCAMTCAMYLSSLGGSGFRKLAELNRDKAEYLKAGLLARGFVPITRGGTFNEFALRAPAGFDTIHRRLIDEKRILFGLELAPWYPDLAGCYLFCATETRSRADMDGILKEIAR